MDVGLSDPNEQRSRRRSLAAACTGNALEWFDWSLYGILSVYLASNLFDSGNPTSAVLSTLAVFAVGFVARPIGGLLFGRLGDRIGRKRVMVTTMSMLAISSVALAVLPTYESVGALASVLLLVTRLVQGLAHGGEVGVTYTYAAEIAPRDKRGLWSSFVLVANTVGLMLATATAAVLTATLGSETMHDYGWRIGFAIGGVLGLGALYLRRTAIESDVYEAERAADDATAAPAPPNMSRADYVRMAMKIVMISVGSNITFYAWVTFAPGRAIAEHDMNQNVAFMVTLLAEACILLMLPFLGHISDRIGRKPFVIGQGVLMIALAVPIAMLVNGNPWSLFLSVLLGLFVWAVQASVFVAVAAEQAPTQVRATTLGLVISGGAALFGGTGPYLNSWLSSIDKAWIFDGYIMVLGVIVIAGGIWIRETRSIDLRDLDVQNRSTGTPESASSRRQQIA